MIIRRGRQVADLARRLVARFDVARDTADELVRQLVLVLDPTAVSPEEFFDSGIRAWSSTPTTVSAGGAGNRSMLQIFNNSTNDNPGLVIVTRVQHGATLANISGAVALLSANLVDVRVTDRHWARSSWNTVAVHAVGRSFNAGPFSGTFFDRMPIAGDYEPRLPIAILTPQTGVHADPGSDNTALTQLSFSGYEVDMPLRRGQ